MKTSYLIIGGIAVVGLILYLQSSKATIVAGNSPKYGTGTGGILSGIGDLAAGLGSAVNNVWGGSDSGTGDV